MAKMTVQEIHDRVSQVVNRIANATDVASFAALMKNHFTSISYLANLSWNNQMLAILQGATGEVRTYKQWKLHGRMVQKGETSHIMLIRPNFFEKKNKKGEKERGMYFVPYAVFDISQTYTHVSPFDSLVDAVERKVKAENPAERYFGMLMNVCDNLNINYREMPLGHGHYGYSSGGNIVIANNLVLHQKVGTLAHEIAHEVLHQNIPVSERTREVKNVAEYEAEMVAAVVMDYFGLDNPFSASYVKMYGADRDKLTATMKSVQNAVSIILKAMEKKEEEEEEVQVAA